MLVGDGWLLTAARAAIHTPTGTAVVSDLHLGYAEARRRGGEAVPAPTVADCLEPLRLLFRRYSVGRLVIAGDLFEARASTELVDQLLAWFQGQSVELAAVVPGNHDRGIMSAAGPLPVYPAGYSVGRWQIVHGDGELPDTPFVQGHEHPWFRWTARTSAPCYLIGPKRLILPAYSADAAGVNVLRQRTWRNCRCAVIAGDEVLDLGPLGNLTARLRGRRELEKQ
jgi:metallophosphoesterase superfamily enzyme